MAAALSSPASVSPGGTTDTQSMQQQQQHHDMQLRATSEVLLVCLIHDSPRLRAAWSEVFLRTLEPLLRALSRLHSSSRVMVGGVIYRSEPVDTLASQLRPLEALSCVPFVPIRHFAARAHEALLSQSIYTLAQLDGARLESPFADALAAVVDLLDSREKLAHVKFPARSAVRARDTPIVARHIVHALALDANVAVCPVNGEHPMQLPAFSWHQCPRLHMQRRLDSNTCSDLVQDLNARRICFSTVVYSPGTDETSVKTRALLTQSAHDTLCLSRSLDQRVDPPDLLGAQNPVPPTVSMLLSGLELTRLLRKRPNLDLSTDSPNKRLRPPSTPTTPTTPTFKMDHASLNRIVLIQQQQATMLKNLARYVATGQKPTPSVPANHSGLPKTLEQFRQRIVAQQLALKQQAERLRANKPLDLAPILHALAAINADAKELGINLGGSSNSVATTRSAPSAPSSRASSSSSMPSTSDDPLRPHFAWQGILRWNTSPNTSPSFTLVTATCGSTQVKQNLNLPWPNIMTMSGFFPVESMRLQHFLTKNRQPCALLSLRSFPANINIKNAENNETNYQMLATMLEQNKRAAYIPHGAPQCGILVVALSSARLPPSQAANAPRLLAIVFSTPIPFTELSAPPVASTSSNARGMINMPASSPVAAMAPLTMSNPILKPFHATATQPQPQPQPSMAAAAAAPIPPPMIGLTSPSLSAMNAQHSMMTPTMVPAASAMPGQFSTFLPHMSTAAASAMPNQVMPNAAEAAAAASSQMNFPLMQPMVQQPSLPNVSTSLFSAPTQNLLSPDQFASLGLPS